MKPSDVNGKDLNGIPEPVLLAAMEKLKTKEHYWIGTVQFEMKDDDLRGGEINLNLNQIMGQNIRCVICGMDWKPRREGRVCPGVPK